MYVKPLESKNNLFSNKEEKELENKYNIKNVRLKEVDKNILYNILENMEEVYKEFPQLKDKLKEIKAINSEKSGLNITPDINDGKYVMEISSEDFSVESKTEERYKADLKNNFHPKGTTYKNMGQHELGHCAIYEVIKKKYTRKDDIVNDWNNNITAEEITQKAFDNLGISDKITKSMLRKNISEYSISNYGETIAEAFADYYSNKNNAHVLSKEIIKVMKGMM